jgi:hypothetical protein
MLRLCIRLVVGLEADKCRTSDFRKKVVFGVQIVVRRVRIIEKGMAC